MQNNYNYPHNLHAQLPEIKFWEDEQKGIINPKLFSDKAKEIAEIFKEERKDPKSRKDNDKINKTTQIRKFYDELLRIRGLIKSEDDFKKQLAYIYMIKAKVAYSKGRKLVSDAFYNFINILDKVNTLQDFDIFLNLYEAIIAYYKMLNPKED
jgi:CRISPR-associated protein Csm2